MGRVSVAGFWEGASVSEIVLAGLVVVDVVAGVRVPVGAAVFSSAFFPEFAGASCFLALPKTRSLIS